MKHFELLTFSVCLLIIADPHTLRVGTRRNSAATTGFALYEMSEGIVRHASIEEQEDVSKGGRPTPEAIWNSIRAAARDEVTSHSPLIMPPKFDVRQVGSTWQLTIVKGDVGDLGFEDDPYGLPFKDQILIEALRASLVKTDLTAKEKTAAKAGTPGKPQGAESEDYWQPYLISAETVVKSLVVDIEANSDRNLSKEALRQKQDQIDEVLYDQVYQAVEQYAKRNGYSTIYRRGGDEVKRFSVTVSTQPVGGKVWLMTGLVYKKERFANPDDPSKWRWKEVVQNPLDLLGGYHYRAVWPDGRKAEGDIEISNANPVTFLPN
jgi:hypothetical protein